VLRVTQPVIGLPVVWWRPERFQAVFPSDVSCSLTTVPWTAFTRL